jgi:prolyl oligopeptidase
MRFLRLALLLMATTTLPTTAGAQDAAAATTPAAAPAAAAAPDDPHAWLEEVEGERALAWVDEQNRRTLPVLTAMPEYQQIYDRTLEILDSKEKIPAPQLLGETVYNFWKDDQHERGLWRRTTLASYRTATPEWETVIDVDALAKADGQSWVWGGASCLPPAYRHCLVSLSRGGSDAEIKREFDTVTKQFVDGGFALPEAKSFMTWRDQNSVWVGTDFGPGSLSTSGYPLVVKLWQRGTPLTAAKTIFTAPATDVYAYAASQFTGEHRDDFVVRVPQFYRQETFTVRNDELVKVEIPEDANFHFLFENQALVSLRSPWQAGGKTYPAGALLALDFDELLRGGRAFTTLFEPTDRSSLQAVSSTRDRVLVDSLDNVRGRLASWSFAGGAWKREEVELPGLGTIGVSAASDEADVYFYSYTDFLTPTTLWLVQNGGKPEKTKTNPTFFDATGMTVAQHEATSADGEKIPYFVVMPKGFTPSGTAPTLLYGYGGFENAEVPTYSSTRGTAWLARGGVFVLANIRGGGEFGPRWHEAALKQNRIKSFQDFIAIAEDLIARKITSPKHLGIMGGSQGGLLVGGAMAMRPDLFGAVVAQVPLGDMRRFSKLLAGASWMAEYGNPDVPEEWAYIQTWSPYHLLRKDAKYPTPFFWTNTRDDRVHPGHARKMVARMMELGHPVYYFENTEGGHGSGAVNKQTAHVSALEYSYLWKMLR